MSHGVYKKIQLVSAEISKEGIAKKREGQVGAGKIKFRGIDDVYNALSSIISSVGLVVVPTVLSCERSVINRDGGKFSQHVHLEMQFKLFDPDDGSSVEGSSMGESIDTSDKACGKAHSYAYKNFMFQLLCIPLEGQDNDVENHNHNFKPASITREQANELNDLIEEVNADLTALKAFYKIESIESMPKELYGRVRAALEKKKANPELEKLKKTME